MLKIRKWPYIRQKLEMPNMLKRPNSYIFQQQCQCSQTSWFANNLIKSHFVLTSWTVKNAIFQPWNVRFCQKNTKSGNVIKSQKVCVQFLYQHVSWIGEKVTFSEFCTQKIHGQTVQFNLRSCSFSILAPDFAVELLGNCLIYRHFPLIYQILSKSNVYYFCQALGGRINFFPISGLKHICWMVFGYKVKGLWPFPPIFSMEFVKKNDETFPECPKCKILLTITKSGNFVNILSKNLLLNNSASAPERKILENNVFTLVHVIH